MEKTAAELERLIAKGDVVATSKFFIGMKESDRKPFAKTAEASFKAARKKPYLESPPGHFARNPALCAGTTAVFSCCSLATLKSLGHMAIPWDNEMFEILLDRHPDWCDELAEFLIADDHPAWMQVRALMKAGLCRKPKHDNYVLGMFGHHSGVGNYPNCSPYKERGVLKHLLEEPDLLEDIWRIFEIEGGGEYSLAGHDKYSPEGPASWGGALVELSRRGVLPRERLLDESLASLDRGFLQFRAGWFSAFHEMLEPTIAERAARADKYLHLLASPIPPTVSFALKAVDLVDQQSPLASRRLIESLAPVLLSRAKATAKTGLKILDRVAGRDRAAAPLASLSATKALLHEATDVQNAVITFLERHGSVDNDELRGEVTRHVGSVASSLKNKLQSWLKSTAAPIAQVQAPKRDEGAATLAALRTRAKRIPEQWRTLARLDQALAALAEGRLELTACPFDGADIPRLDPSRKVAPVATLDELIDAAAAALESRDDNDAFERVLDGVSRLCHERPADFESRTGPLRKRCRQLMSRLEQLPFYGSDPYAHLIGVVLAWVSRDPGIFQATKWYDHPAIEYRIDGVAQMDNSAPKHPTDPLGIRAQHLAERAARGESGLMLSAPTHLGGWIDAAVLVGRVRDLNGAAANDIDVALALLRLAPDGRDAALASLKGVRGEIAAACRYALGGHGEPQAKQGWLWIAASRARSPWQCDEQLAAVVKNAGPDAAEPAAAAFKIGDVKKYMPLKLSVHPELPKEIDSRHLTVCLWQHAVKSDMPLIEWKHTAAIRGAQSIWPLAMEAVCAAGAKFLGANLDWWEARWANRTYLEPLLVPDLPLRDMARLLLVLALAAKEPGERGLAVDACIAAIGDRRLDGGSLGRMMGRLWPSGMITLNRWAGSLGQVAQVSALHAETIRVALDVSLHASPKQLPSDVQALLTLLLELVHETGGSVSDETRKILSRLSGSSKAARAAKAILSCTGPPSADRIAEIMQADAEARIIRAERWQAREAS